MADIHQPQPAKLICGMISGDETLLAATRDELQDRFGPADCLSEVWPFDFTDYYAPQMGETLWRQFLAFERLIDPGRLADIKRQTNAMEDTAANMPQAARGGASESARGGAPAPPRPSSSQRDAAGAAPRTEGRTHAYRIPRPINLDPGYLTPAKLVLASAKDFAHRVYLGGGIYAEVTLQYRGGWQKLDWTFPDYASGRYSAFMTHARNILMSQLREARP